MILAMATETTALQQIMDIFEKYGSFGPILAICLPLLESFLPFLPLFLFVFANAASFGFFAGFFYSWLGACIGAILVFTIVRKYGQTRFFHFLNRHPKMKALIDWMDERGFAPIFLVFCFPFTPSALINIVAGLSKAKRFQFILALVLGKMVMIGSISYIGHDIRSFFIHPMKTFVVLGVIVLMWLVGKLIEKKIGLVKHGKSYENGQGVQWGKKRRKQHSNG